MSRYTPIEFKFWKAYAIHMRPYLLFLSGIAGLSGMAIAVDFQITQPTHILAGLSFFLAYGFGQALTDTWQVDTDRISSPYRPLSQDIITVLDVRSVSLIGLILCAGIFIYLNSCNILFGALSILGLATYSYVKKHYWFGGPFHNASIVALLPLMGYLAVDQGGLNSLKNVELSLTVLLNFFAYTNFVLVGYLKDITADRQTGYQTIPVVFGWAVSTWIADIFLVLSIYLGSLLIGLNMYSIICFSIGSLIAVSGLVYAHFTNDKSENNAYFPILSTVRAFILWNLAIILNYNPGLVWFAMAYYIAFEIVLHFRPMKEQI